MCMMGRDKEWNQQVCPLTRYWPIEHLEDQANCNTVLFQKKSALASSPNILELLSHSFFVGGYFVGPQFTMKKYQQVSPKFLKQLLSLKMHLLLSKVTTPEYQAQLPNPGPLSFGLRRLLLAVGYMLLHVIGSICAPETLGFSFIWPLLLRVYVFAWDVAYNCILSGVLASHKVHI